MRLDGPVRRDQNTLVLISPFFLTASNAALAGQISGKQSSEKHSVSHFLFIHSLFLFVQWAGGGAYPPARQQL